MMATKRKVRITRKHRIAYLLVKLGPQTRYELLEREYFLAPKGTYQGPFRRENNHDYFNPCNTPYGKKSIGRWSIVAKKQIDTLPQHGKNGAKLYAPNATTTRLAREYQESFE